MSTAGRADRSSAVKLNASVRELQEAFREARAPDLATLLGSHDGEVLGPAWLRQGAALTFRLSGMPGWCGKTFHPATSDADTLEGENLVRRHGRTEPSIPIQARIVPSRIDGRPAIVIRYPTDARFPWRRVTDELRPLDDRTLLGLSFGIPLGPRGGSPFVLRRADRTG